MIDFIGRFFKEGGFFMYPITLLFAFGVAVVIERFFVLFKKYNLDSNKYFNFVEQRILNKDLDDIAKNSPDTPLSNIFKFGIDVIRRCQTSEDTKACEMKLFKGERRASVVIEKTIEEIAALEFPKIERRLNFLPTIANLSTLLGLLGTLQGLIQAFSSLSNVDPSQKAQFLAQGISVAMNTTAYGLFVAVIILFMYTILNARAERLMEETEYYVLKFINLVTMRY